MSVRKGNSFVAGNTTLKIQDKIYALNRVVDGNVETYQLADKSADLGISDGSRYSFLITVSNTTQNPKLVIGSTILVIKNAVGDILAPGDLPANSLQQFYCTDVLSGEIRVGTAAQSYLNLTDKPMFNGIPMVGNVESKDMNMVDFSKSDGVYKLLVDDFPIIHFDTYKTWFGDYNKGSYLYSKNKPGWYNGRNFDTFVTKTDLDAFAQADDYKGVVKYCRDTKSDMIKINKIIDGDTCFVINDSMLFEVKKGTWVRQPLQDYNNGDYFEVMNFKDDLSGRIIYNDKIKKWDVFKDYSSTMDNVTISKDEITHVVSVLKVPNPINFLYSAEDAIHYDGSGEVSIDLSLKKLGAAADVDLNSKANKGIVKKYNLITQDYEGTIRDTGVSYTDIFSVPGGKLDSTMIPYTLANDSVTVHDMFDNVAYINENNDFSKRPTVNGVQIATVDLLYDDSKTLTCDKQVWSDEQKEVIRQNIGAGTSDFDLNYNGLSNKPSISGVELNSDTTAKSIGIYPGAILKADAEDYVLSDNDLLTLDIVRQLLSFEDDTLVSKNQLNELLADVGKFKIFEAKFSNNFYRDFTAFEGTVAYGKISYTRRNIVRNSDGSVICTDSKMYLTDEGDFVRYNSYVDRKNDIDLQKLKSIPVVLQRKEPKKYKFSDSYIVNGGTGYSSGDVLSVNTFEITVNEVDASGHIVSLVPMEDSIKNTERDTNYAGDYKAIGGLGSGAVIRLRTYYVPGDTVDRGSLSNVNESDPLAQETFVLGQINKRTQRIQRYSSGNASMWSTMTFRNDYPELSVTHIADNSEHDILHEFAVTVASVGGKEGVYFRSDSTYDRLQTESDVIKIVTNAVSGLYLGTYDYFVKSSEIASILAVDGDTAIVSDTLQKAKYVTDSWLYSQLDCPNGSYAKILKIQPAGKPGTVTYYTSSDGSSWTAEFDMRGQADGVTLQQNSNGSIGIKFDSDTMVSGYTSESILYDSTSRKSVKDSVLELKSLVDSNYKLLNEGKLQSPTDKTYNHILAWGTDGNLTTLGLNATHIVNTDDSQVITGPKSFTGNLIVSTVNVTGMANFARLPVVDGATVYTTKVKPSAKDIGAEPAFSKNTAFNVNFGDSEGTAAQGNDVRFNALDITEFSNSLPVPNGHTHKVVLTKQWLSDVISDVTDNTSFSLDGGNSKVAGSVYQIRRASKAQWKSSNPVLDSGEFGFETDTNKVKIGNGLTKWNELQYTAVNKAAQVFVRGAEVSYLSFDKGDPQKQLDEMYDRITLMEQKVDKMLGEVYESLVGLTTPREVTDEK